MSATYFFLAMFVASVAATKPSVIQVSIFLLSFVLSFPSLKAILSFRTGLRKIRSLSSSRDQRTSHGLFHHVCQQSNSDRTAENSQHHGSISCSLVSVSLPPFSTAHRSLVQSCTISRVTSVPISTTVEIMLASFALVKPPEHPGDRTVTSGNP